MIYYDDLCMKCVENNGVIGFCELEDGHDGGHNYKAFWNMVKHDTNIHGTFFPHMSAELQNDVFNYVPRTNCKNFRTDNKRLFIQMRCFRCDDTNAKDLEFKTVRYYMFILEKGER